MAKSYLFTSESVSEGHPDKVADQISDAILDAFLEQDKFSRVACETLIAKNCLVIAGEISSKGTVDYKKVAGKVLKDIGYGDSSTGFDFSKAKFTESICEQSADIAVGVNAKDKDQELGAGDQGLMFGYACDETEDLMPLPLYLSHKLLLRLTELRKAGAVDWLKPDSKSQVTVKYQGDRPVSVERVVLSTQHSDSVETEELRRFITKEVIEKTIDEKLRSDKIEYFINPTGRFVNGGPQADTGLTGRKIIVDTYGGSCPHGGGAFSGKDPTKVDRSAAYMARYIAKNLVSAEIARRVTVQLAYAIGISEPLSLFLDFHGTGRVPEVEAVKLLPKFFKLTPTGIIDSLDLRRPIYQKTACYGHFGRPLAEFTWERTDKAEELKRALL